MQLDSGTVTQASGTSSWSYAFPVGATTWKLGTSHTIKVGVYQSGSLGAPLLTLTVRKGVNHDVNGDGYPDVIVGAPNTTKGNAYLFYSSGTGGITSTTAGNAGTVTMIGPASGSNFGRATALGDINGDGYADAIVGASNTTSGSVYVLYSTLNGGAWGIVNLSTAGLVGDTLTGASAGSQFGRAVAVGDVNGDGYDDIVAGAPNTSSGNTYSFYGASGGVGSLTAGGAGTNTQTGISSGTGFGLAAAIGDTNGDGNSDLVVGAPQSQLGNAYVFYGTSSGLPSATAGGVGTNTLTGANRYSFFGSALALGDFNDDGYADIAIGAPGQTGSVYAIYGSSGGISNAIGGGAGTNTLTGPSWASQCGSGVAVGDLNGDGYADVIIGAPGTTDGDAYVFLSSSSGVANATGGSGGSNTLAGAVSQSQFGASLSSGDYNGDGYADLLVGSAELSTGYAYTFTSSSSGPGNQAAGLGTSATLTGPSSNAQFGMSLDGGSGGGAQNQWVNLVNLHLRSVVETGFLVGTSHGVSQVGLQLDGGTPQLATGTQNWSLKLPTGSSRWKQGSSHTITVGTYGASALSYPVQSITVTVGQNRDLNGDGYPDIFIGAYNTGSLGDGAAYLYYGGHSLPSSLNIASADIFFEGISSSGEGFGQVAAFGDINGDGYADILTSGPYFNGGAANDGAAYVFYGGASPASVQQASTASIVLSSVAGSSQLFGGSVALGDVNGDGYDDLLVGAYGYNNGSYGDGAAYFFWGGAALGSALAAGSANVLFKGLTSSVEQLGDFVAMGDVNKDGKADIVLSATNFGTSTSGAAYVFYGATSFASSVSASAANVIITAPTSSADKLGFGSCVRDWNGDGIADIFLGAAGYNNGAVNDGAVFVFFGSLSLPATLATTAANVTLKGVSFSAESFGAYSLSLGDVNGDGYPDLAVGAYAYTNGTADAGAVYIFEGSSSLPATFNASAANITIKAPPSQKDYLAYNTGAVSLSDINADGFSDALIGAVGYNNGLAGDGAMFLFYGASSLASSMLTSSANVTLLGAAGGTGNLGNTIAGN